MKQGFDPTTLEIYRALYTSVAEEMGLTLRRTAHSPNIKERRDYSCAAFDSKGRGVAQGDQMPVALAGTGHEAGRTPRPERRVGGGVFPLENSRKDKGKFVSHFNQSAISNPQS